ncbi:hypothetical protein ABTM51_21405, partial [Acinetobacter baumannii]
RCAFSLRKGAAATIQTAKRILFFLANYAINAFLHLIEKFYFEIVNDQSFHHITDKELLDKFYIDKNNEWLGILLQR